MDSIKLHLKMMFNLPPGFLTSFLSSQLRPLPAPDGDFTGKTVVVTGANVGLGREAARHFVRLGASKVILACRNTEKGEAAKDDIIFSAPGSVGRVEVWPVDLGSFESVRQFCKRATDTLERLDVVVENAAVAIGTFTLQEGYETTITTNVISTFLMAFMLLPKMRETAVRYNTNPHLSFVGSDAHYFARFAERSEPSVFESFRHEKGMSEDRYNTSKLLVIMLASELAIQQRQKQQQVVINALNPGFCRSDLFRHAPFPLNVVIWLGLRILGRTAEMGSRTLVHAASTGPEMHGKYLDSCKPWDPSPYVLSEEGKQMQKKLYAELKEILEGIEPGVTAQSA